MRTTDGGPARAGAGERLRDAAVLALRLGAAWVVAEHALRRLAEGPPDGAGEAAAQVELACAAMLAAGLGLPIAGGLTALLAAAGAGAVWAGRTDLPGVPDDAGAAQLALLSAACLLAAVTPGRYALDRLARRGARRVRGAPSERARARAGGPGGSFPSRARRPEEAPPLPYPEGRAATTRPSRT
ncbi:histidine kinase [Nocardiopsis sp. RSe5-2]|uniref:Histidine kinase n=1 Tax=Nocardiopsis endophytica TaxID=3018445 RepID=A0ABT4U4U0_9ACTN|nr:histidine kinase [Nocardiopsis endophytica]MDA2811957.1 histidine kinase [Nocardiopsis endophytica]